MNLVTLESRKIKAYSTAGFHGISFIFSLFAFVSLLSQFKTSEDVLKGARHMVAMQIAHEPLVKQVVRTVFYERAMISTACTKKGVKVSQKIMKYIKATIEYHSLISLVLIFMMSYLNFHFRYMSSL